MGEALIVIQEDCNQISKLFRRAIADTNYLWHGSTEKSFSISFLSQL